MGLISALSSSVSSVMREQWKDYFYCDSIPVEILVTKAEHKTKGTFGVKNSGDNIISNGSMIAVNEGQCMIIVEQGKVVDLCAEPGEYIYDISTEPSIFAGGGLAHNILEVFKNIGKRFTYGGVTPKDQRVYYFNLKEILSNKYGTANPVPFRVVDKNIGLDIDISVRCFGEYSYRITNPILFYTNVCGNVKTVYRKDEMESQLKSEFLTALQPAFARISEMGIRYSSVIGHTQELADAMNEVLSNKWGEIRGIEIVSVGVNSLSASEEDEKMLKELQKGAVFRDPSMAAGHLVEAQAAAMKAAASNSAGAPIGFMGMNMAASAGGMNAGDLYGMAANQAAAQNMRPASAGGWVCSCGKENTGKFCSECGKAKPEESWTCSCGTVNTGKFCSECGKPKAEGPWTCSCGAVNTGKFCAECGKPRA